MCGFLPGTYSGTLMGIGTSRNPYRAIYPVSREGQGQAAVPTVLTGRTCWKGFI